MASKDDCIVIVTIEMGHQANFLKETSPEGFTHDWTVFVGGHEGSKIEHFVDRVVFNLHKTFKMPIRAISAPPYKVSECGYAGFILPIDIYFKTKQKPRKITFTYDLFLNANDHPPINHVRYEKLKFQNPTPDFKAKLIKAGGMEQGSGPVQAVVSDRFYSIENKASKPVEKKHKEKKKKKVSPPPVPSSPHPSLSSLSPTTSSDEEVEKPFSSKRDKEPPSLKRESFSLSSLKKESSSSSKDKLSKHKSVTGVEKVKHSSEKHKKETKPHKAKKDKEKSGSEHHREDKKEKDSSSHKSKEGHSSKHKEREGSHSSNKSSSSSLGEKESKSSSSSSHKEKSSKEKSSKSKEKHKSSHKSKNREEKLSSKEKEKHSHKETSSSSSSLVMDVQKKVQGSSKSKSSHEKEKHSKHSHKRSLSPGEVIEKERKKLKRSNSGIEPDVKNSKSASSEKEKTVPVMPKEIKDVKPKESQKLTSLAQKSKEHKKKSSDKSQHLAHSSDSKSKTTRDNASLEKKVSPSEKQSDAHQRTTKSEKSESFTKSEKLALSADFQPQLLLSPIKSRSEDEDCRDHAPIPTTEAVNSKKRKRQSSLSSLSSLSSDPELDNESEKLNEKAKCIVSGLADSDSDLDGPPVSKSPPKEAKPVTHNKDGNAQKQKKSNSLKPSEKSKKSHGDSGHSKGISSVLDKKSLSRDVKEHGKRKAEDKDKSKNSDSHSKGSSPGQRNLSTEPSKNGLNVLAPNGIPLGDLITINEKIEKAQNDFNNDLINNIIDVIADTDEFDIDDSAVFFDICSLDKNCILQIQNILRD